MKRNFHLSVFYFKTIRLLIFSKQCGDWEMHDCHPGLKTAWLTVIKRLVFNDLIDN
ncbi:hypothetical protein Pvag_pPag30403 (plasmid) [Pantoea vagans C9-1]|nr:hypothetical protein Pvag_pPag30403 [Pantoea vagans C9-1]